MTVYDLKKIEKCYVCGNIDKSMDKFIQALTSHLSNYTKVEHPKEIERQERLKRKAQSLHDDLLRGRVHQLEDGNNGPQVTISRNSILKKMPKLSRNSGYNNSVIIVSGNCGIGSKSLEYYLETFENLDKILRDNNCFVFFVRGNNDNPSIFHDCKINFEHVKTIPDYSVVCLKSFNCLCIGGSISLDKEWKLSQEEAFGKKLYWEGEQPFFNEKELDEILTKYKIGCVISSTCPSFAFPGTNVYNKSKWFKNNAEVKNSFRDERKILDKIYDKIMENDSKPYVWAYGRFKQGNQAKVNDIIFDSIQPYQFEEIGYIISSYFGIDVSKKLGDNTFALDSFINDYQKEPCNGHYRYVEEHAEEPEAIEEVVDEMYRDEDDGRTEEAPRADGNFINHEPFLYDATITQEAIERVAQELQATITRPTVEDIEMRFEMPQYTITNGRVEILRRDG